MQMVLKERGLWGFVEGTEPGPDRLDVEAVESYKAKAKKAYSTICLTLAESAAEEAREAKTAAQLLRREFPRSF